MKTLASITYKFFLRAVLFVFLPVTLTAQGDGKPFPHHKYGTLGNHLMYDATAQSHHFFSTDKSDIAFLLEFNLIADPQLTHGMSDHHGNSLGYNGRITNYARDLRFFNDSWGVSLYKVVTSYWMYPLACSGIGRYHSQHQT